MRRLVLFAALGVGLSFAGGAGSATAPSPFQSGKCPFQFFTHQKVDCGTLSVPENRTKANSRTITLQVAIVRASGSSKKADPIVFQNGGPSFPSVEPWGMSYFDGTTLGVDRDVILVDRRGEGSSMPRLTCPELNDADRESFYAQPLIGTGDLERYQAAIRACHDRWVAQGVDLSGYNLEENVADFETLRKALGITKWNFFAISADGPLGMTYLRVAPGGLRSMVIDAAQSSTMNIGIDYKLGQVEQTEYFLAGCAANAACAATYPNLRTVLYDYLDELKAHPVIVEVKVAGKTIRVPYDDGWFLNDLVNGADYWNVQGTFWAIWTAAHGGLQEVVEGWFGTNPPKRFDYPPKFNGYDDVAFSNAYGAAISYICHDVLAFTTQQDFERAAQEVPHLASRFLDPFFDFAYGKAACSVWNNGAADRAQHAPFTTKVPVLIGIGELDGDGGVPPRITRQISAMLPKAYSFEFPATGHVVFGLPTYRSIECAQSIAMQFVASPTVRPDSSCIASIAPFDYTP